MHKVKQMQSRKKNRGFSLLTVIVSVSFIGILGMLILYMALVNFNMKITDLKGKDSFYTAEQALEEIRTGLQEDVGEAMSVAYTKVLETYSANADVNTDATLDELRQSSFRELFIDELVDRLKNGENKKQYSLTKLNGYLDMTDTSTRGENKIDTEKETMVVVNPEGKTPDMTKDVKNGVLLKNLKAIYVDSAGRASIIETDIRLGIPKVQFPTPSTLPDLMHMSVIADGGIVCEAGNVGDETVIQGKVYAGLLEEYQKKNGSINVKDGSDCVSVDIKPGANLSVQSGDLFVCQGNINTDVNSTFTSGSSVSVWAQGINLTSATVELLGKTYLADDLAVNKGNGSNVTIKGEYYGFGNPSEESQDIKKNPNWIVDSGKNPLYTEAGRITSALSSAIVINGKNTTMDLSGLEKIMLAGKNYIASSQIAGKRTNSNDVMTGESLTVKGTQLAYLAPSEILADGNCTNPMTYQEYFNLIGGENSENNISINHDVLVADWGNRTIDQIGVDSLKPVQEVFYNDNSAGDGGYVYIYLNFTDTSKAAAFMQNYYSDSNVTSETSSTDSGKKKTMKEKVDEYLSFYFGNNAGVTVNDPQTYLRYITNGNVLTYSGETKTGKMNSATDSIPGKTLREEQANYQQQWYALNRRMIMNYELLNKKVTKSDGKTFDHDETDCSRSVFDNMVNEEGLKNFIDSKANDANRVYEFHSSADAGGFTAIFTDNNEDLVIDEGKASSLRLVVSTGNVKIAAGVKFYGIIMAKGKIILGSNSQLISSPLDAAKIFQAQSVEDNISPKDLFWDGEKYVLGNTTTTDDGASTENKRNNTYDLAECVTYENWKKK